MLVSPIPQDQSECSLVTCKIDLAPSLARIRKAKRLHQSGSEGFGLASLEGDFGMKDVRDRLNSQVVAVMLPLQPFSGFAAHFCVFEFALVEIDQAEIEMHEELQMQSAQIGIKIHCHFCAPACLVEPTGLMMEEA